MAENNEVKSRREQQLERLRKKYPEKKFEEDEEVFGQIYDDYDQYEQELEGYRGREKTLSDMFAADPRSAQFLSDMRGGRSPWASYIRLFGPELKESLEDPATIEQIAEAEREYMERVAQSKKLDEEYEQNISATYETLRKYKEERGLSDEQIDSAMAALIGIAHDAVVGKFAPDTIDMIVKAMNYDADVATASEEGEIAGRNAKITETLRKSKQGDGTAPLGGKNGQPKPQEDMRPKSVFDLAREAK